MLTFRDYLDKAKENQAIPSDRQLAQVMKISSSAMTEFSKERSFPSQETVLKLANLAGIRPEQALIDFNLWKTKDKPNAHRIWQKLAKMVANLSVILVFTLNTVNRCNSDNYSPTPENSSRITNIHYATNLGVDKWTTLI